MKLNVDKIRKSFPTFKENKKRFVYFDNACMTLKPQPVLDAIMEYYLKYPGCHGRTNHFFGAQTTKYFENSRKKIQKFFKASSEKEIVFLRNTTEGINLLANSIDFKAGETIISSDLEHNSNLIPWQVLAKKKSLKRIIIPTKDNTEFDFAEYEKQIKPGVKLVTVLHTSNLSGVTFPIQKIIDIAHENGALVCIDAAQSSLYREIDVQKLNPDFLVTSLHKMWGPTGIGILYGKEELLEQFPVFLSGGETVLDSTYNSVTYANIPDKFEAGLQNYAGVIGAGAAIDFINKTGQKQIYSHIISLNRYATEKISSIKDIEIIGPEDAELRSGILNFLIKDRNCFNISRILNEAGHIMTRVGKHCVHSWFNQKNIEESMRISFSAYNSFEEIDIFINALKNVLKFYK
jgi:cysteine desulfurase/selenocysteine lyase